MWCVIGRWLGGMALLAAFAAPRAEAAEPAVGAVLGVSPVYRYAHVRLETGDEPAPQPKTGAGQSEPRDGFFIIAPLNEGEEPLESAHPDQPARWYVGYTVGAARAATGKSGTLERGLSLIDIGANYQEFVFFPNGGSVARREPTLSIYLSIHETRYVAAAEAGTFIPSLRVTYLYEHRVTGKAGAAAPGAGGAVNSAITAAPTAIGALIIHPAVIYEPSETAAYRFAFAPQYTFYNNQNKGNPWLDKERLRMEGWIHYFPVAGHSFRVQAGLYSDRTVRGDTVDQGTEIGVMFQLRRDIRAFDW